jgi:hypothetical protein
MKWWPALSLTLLSLCARAEYGPAQESRPETILASAPARLHCQDPAMIERAFESALVRLHSSLLATLAQNNIELRTLDKSDVGPLETDRHFRSYFRRLDLSFTTAKGTPLTLGCRHVDEKTQDQADAASAGLLLVIAKDSPRLEVERDNEGNAVKQSCVADFALFASDLSQKNAYRCHYADGEFQVVNAREGALVATGDLDPAVETQ